MKATLCAIIGALTAASAVEAAEFTAKPTAASDGANTIIRFAVDQACDVMVAVVDKDGQVVRHLAAGVLGAKNPAPEPLKTGMTQECLWDMQDDTGHAASGGPFKVRVSLGVRPRLEKYVGWDPQTLGPILGLAVGPDGAVYVLSGAGFRGPMDMRVFDRSGRYLRTIIPYGAGTPKERTASVGQLEVAGQRLPIVYNGLGHTTYPLTSGMRQQRMAWHPKGYLVLVSALGTMAEHGPPRHLLALHPEGGAPEGVDFVGPRLRTAKGFLGGTGEGAAGEFAHLAASADGQFIYVSANPRCRFDGKRNGVLRVTWSDPAAGALWLGKDEAGSDDEHFNDPEGLATDKAGHLYVCDWGNNRVQVFAPDGQVLGHIAVDKPQQVAVHPQTGEIYTLSCSPAKSGWLRVWGDDTVLRKFSSWGKGEAKELASLDQRGLCLMALDGSTSPAKLWTSDGKTLLPVTDEGGRLTPGAPIGNTVGLTGPQYIAADPQRDRVFLYEGGRVMTLDLASGRKAPFCKGTAMALDREGNVYVIDGYGTQSVSRYDPQGKPLAFKATGSHVLKIGTNRCYGPDMSVPGLRVTPAGDICVFRTNNSEYGGVDGKGTEGAVDVYGPDGALKRAAWIDGLGHADCGVAVDATGNVYVGSNIKSKANPLPAPFAGKVPAEGWVWWRKEREKPWCYPYSHPYLFNLGSVLKFGPEGGQLYGFSVAPKTGDVPPPTAISNAPVNAVVYTSGYLARDIKVSGLKWSYTGCSPVPSSDCTTWGDPQCCCYGSQLDADEYGRVFAPNACRFSVEVLDSAGNPVARLGRYGNVDSPPQTGPGSQALEPAFAWPAFISVAGGKVYVSDTVNRRVAVIALEYAVAAESGIPWRSR